MQYNWQLPDWPNFTYDLTECEPALLEFVQVAGQVNGVLKTLPESVQMEAIVDVMIAEAIKTSEIEGEFLSRQDVMSSIHNQLGLNPEFKSVHSQASEGVGQLMVEVRNTWSQPLTEEALFHWHRLLMKGETRLQAGAWRTRGDPMRVISGRIDQPKVHFEAPPASQVPYEMGDFIDWFNRSQATIRHAPVRAAVAHLYFETIHPFEDGNGRIGRAIAEKALSQGLGRPALLSVSRSIEANKKAYYGSLQQTQSSNTITPWVAYFADLVLEAQRQAEQQIDFVLSQAKFFDRYAKQLNERQLRVIQRMLAAGVEGFKGGMNARKYIGLTKVSKATATRDLQALVECGAFVPVGGGRSTRYRLNLVRSHAPRGRLRRSGGAR